MIWLIWFNTYIPEYFYKPLTMVLLHLAELKREWKIPYERAVVGKSCCHSPASSVYTTYSCIPYTVTLSIYLQYMENWWHTHVWRIFPFAWICVLWCGMGFLRLNKVSILFKEVQRPSGFFQIKCSLHLAPLPLIKFLDWLIN